MINLYGHYLTYRCKEGHLNSDSLQSIANANGYCYCEECHSVQDKNHITVEMTSLVELIINLAVEFDDRINQLESKLENIT